MTEKTMASGSEGRLGNWWEDEMKADSRESPGPRRANRSNRIK